MPKNIAVFTRVEKEVEDSLLEIKKKHKMIEGVYLIGDGKVGFAPMTRTQTRKGGEVKVALQFYYRTEEK